MKSKQIKDKHILKVQKGDYLMKTIVDYVQENQLGLAKIEGIGMLENPVIGFMTEDGSYQWTTFEGEWELVSLMGSVSWNDGKAVGHAHVSISDHNLNVKAGHFQDAKIAAVAEVFLTEMSSEKVEKKDFGIAPFKTWDI